MNKQLSEDLVRSIVEEVMQNLRSGPVAGGSCGCQKMKSASGNLGVFPDANSAAAAAKVAFGELRRQGVQGRVKVIEIVKKNLHGQRRGVGQAGICGNQNRPIGS